MGNDLFKAFTSCLGRCLIDTGEILQENSKVEQTTDVHRSQIDSQTETQNIVNTQEHINNLHIKNYNIK